MTILRRNASIFLASMTGYLLATAAAYAEATGDSFNSDESVMKVIFVLFLLVTVLGLGLVAWIRRKELAKDDDGSALSASLMGTASGAAAAEEVAETAETLAAEQVAEQQKQ